MFLHFPTPLIGRNKVYAFLKRALCKTADKKPLPPQVLHLIITKLTLGFTQAQDMTKAGRDNPRVAKGHTCARHVHVGSQPWGLSRGWKALSLTQKGETPGQPLTVQGSHGLAGAGLGLLAPRRNTGFPKAGPISRMVPALSKRASVGQSEQQPTLPCPARRRRPVYQKQLGEVARHVCGSPGAAGT